MASSSARASVSSSPWIASWGSSSPAPARRCRAPRTPSPTGSASRRRATNANVVADAWSNHCASSIRQSSGCSSATSASRLRTANPTKKRSGGCPGGQPERRRQRIALRRRDAIQPIEHRRADQVQPGERQLHLRFVPTHVGDPTPRRPLGHVCQQRRSCRSPLPRGGPARRLRPAWTLATSSSSASHSRCRPRNAAPPSPTGMRRRLSTATAPDAGISSGRAGRAGRRRRLGDQSLADAPAGRVARAATTARMPATPPIDASRASSGSTLARSRVLP